MTTARESLGYEGDLTYVCRCAHCDVSWYEAVRPTAYFTGGCYVCGEHDEDIVSCRIVWHEHKVVSPDSVVAYDTRSRPVAIMRAGGNR